MIGANGAAAKAASPGSLASEFGALAAGSRGLGARGLRLGLALGLAVGAAVFARRFHRLRRHRLAAVPV